MWLLRNKILILALLQTGAIAAWGLVDGEGLRVLASSTVTTMFESRGWFIMLSASFLLLSSIGLAVSRFGRIKLGADHEEPEFGTVSWLSMLFAAGMGVGLLFYGAAEPITHYATLRTSLSQTEAAERSRLFTSFHWGLHAWAIYGMTALVIAYFAYRRGCASLVSAPLVYVFGDNRTTRFVGGLSDLLAIVAIAIGVAGSVAMGVFQVAGGVRSVLGLDAAEDAISMAVYVVLSGAFILPLFKDLGEGMARLSNAALLIAGAILVFVVITGPTSYLLSGVTGGLGTYFFEVIPQGFKTATFATEGLEGWFEDWTLSYMAWWFAWGPFVGVFVARISRGRTIREFVVGVLLVPTVFSIFWFGVFGSLGMFGIFDAQLPLLEVVETRFDDTMFVLLEHLPAAPVTKIAVIIAAALFIVTSVVSAAFVLGTFSSGGDPNPSTGLRVTWGLILAALGLTMIVSDSLEAVRAMISVGAIPFIFVIHLLMACLARALAKEDAT
jgi:glycine betaine transporter